ncbi:MAG: sialate O-acetylesterase [Prevotella sp.]|nr:sialate O-acetylesterase [Prevotella sp.]
MNKKVLFFSLLAMSALSVQAKVRLPHIICDNMILQQQSEARLWGWAKPGKTITVTASWSTSPVTVQTGKDGRWLAKVKTPVASMNDYQITFNDGEPVTVKNVLIGEVWVCAGQSNMEMPVKGFWQCPVKDYNKVVLDAVNHKAVHSVKIPSVMSSTPLDDAQCEWRVCSPKTVGEFSATGYFFARQMHQALGIPIGIIEANKGGSRAESWMTKETLQKYTSDPTDSVEIAKKWPAYDYHRSMLWGNGTFNPILNYTVKGIIYYQGCSNVGDPGDQYSQRMKILVDQWRQQFALGEIPFYFVEIAPWAYDDNNLNGISGALLREQQYKASKIIPNSWLVCTNDLVYPYEFTQIHPAQKQQVGERLAYTALVRDYGMEGLIYKSSSYKDMIVKGDAIFIHLQDNEHTDAPFEDIQGFEIAGEDKVFHPAKAVHFWQPGGGYWDEAIRISSPAVPKPVAVRYCFRNFQIGNVKNAAGLPLFPFRTDNW